MPTQRLTVEELEKIRKVLQSQPTLSEAARANRLAENTLRSRKRILEAYDAGQYQPRKPKVAVGPHEPEAEDGPMPSTLFDERWDTFCRWIGRSQRVTPREKPKKKAARRVILHTGDWHIPYMNEDAFRAVLEANPDADVCVVGGDALNCGAFSRFIEDTTDKINPRDEFARLTLALQAVAERFDEVYVNVGNHPDRIRKYMAKRLDPFAMFLVRMNPIEFVVEGLRKEHGIDHIKVARPVFDEHDGSNWLTLLGDCAFTHAETHGKLHLRPAENTARWLRKWERFLPVRPRVVVQEHNHRGGMFYDDELQCLLIQAPCLSQNVSYQTRGDLKYSPNQWGYCRIVQEDDRTLVNESRFYLLDEGGEARVA